MVCIKIIYTFAAEFVSHINKNMQNTKTIIHKYIHESLRDTAAAKLLFLLLACFICCSGYCQSGDTTATALVKMGFENVSWSENDAERIYMIQNDAYRLEGRGICRAVELIQSMGLPCRKPCVVNILNIHGLI